MKVFISQSGPRSLAIAKALRDWLPRVIQAIEPWMSDADADKGIRWAQKISEELEKTQFGVFCLTPENLDSRWINFEAGAISKSVEGSRVWTYLLDLKPSGIGGPLSQFNHTKAEKDDTSKLIQAINRGLGESAKSEEIVNDTFEAFWPRLEKQLNKLPAANERLEPARKTEDMIEEILFSVRTLLKERSKNARLADNFILSYIPILRAAALRDPNLAATPDLLSAMRELELDANTNKFNNWLNLYSPDNTIQSLLDNLSKAGAEANPSSHDRDPQQSQLKDKPEVKSNKPRSKTKAKR